MSDFRTRLMAAIELRPDANEELVQYWNDRRLDFDAIAHAVNTDGVALLFRVSDNCDAEFCELSWDELEADLPEWRALGDPSAGLAS